jgi:hypothetical protein
MATYRCFILDRESHISERLPIECDNDDDAVIVAGAVLDRRPEMGSVSGWCRGALRMFGHRKAAFRLGADSAG